MTARKPIVIRDGHQQVLPAGDTLLTPQSSSANASLNLPEGSAPASPADGDVWTTSAGMFVQINGVTVGPLGTGGGGGAGWIPLVTGAEPPVLVSDGAGNLVLVAYGP